MRGEAPLTSGACSGPPGADSLIVWPVDVASAKKRRPIRHRAGRPSLAANPGFTGIMWIRSGMGFVPSVRARPAPGLPRETKVMHSSGLARHAALAILSLVTAACSTSDREVAAPARPPSPSRPVAETSTDSAPSPPAPVETPTIRFRDISASAGVTFTHLSGMQPDRHFPTNLGSGAGDARLRRRRPARPLLLHDPQPAAGRARPLRREPALPQPRRRDVRGRDRARRASAIAASATARRSAT